MPVLLLLMIAPFYLNDLLFHQRQGDYPQFITVVYLANVISLGAAAFGIQKKSLSPSDLGLRPIARRPFIFWSVGLSIVGILIDRYLGATLLYPLLKGWAYFEFPAYPNAYWRWFDLTFGLLLGIVAEEVVFRGALLTALRRRYSSFIAGLISMLLFAGIHWGSGPHSLINSLVWALLPTICVIRYCSIYPTLVAHFMTNFVAFYLH